jgi:hypothetical protein
MKRRRYSTRPTLAALPQESLQNNNKDNKFKFINIAASRSLIFFFDLCRTQLSDPETDGHAIAYSQLAIYSGRWWFQSHNWCAMCKQFGNQQQSEKNGKTRDEVTKLWVFYWIEFHEQKKLHPRFLFLGNIPNLICNCFLAYQWSHISEQCCESNWSSRFRIALETEKRTRFITQCNTTLSDDAPLRSDIAELFRFIEVFDSLNTCSTSSSICTQPSIDSNKKPGTSCFEYLIACRKRPSATGEAFC